LFSSILAAFIISSTTNLQEDKQNTMRDILQTISLQLHNTSMPSYKPVNFKAPRWAVRVNSYLYVSLGCTLSSALIAVLALQWIADYDMTQSGITNPREQALYRHSRFEGLKKWYMPEIIAALPMLLHMALVLFFMGLIEWLVQTNMTVAITMAIVVCVVIAFYMITQAAASIFPSAPFRTPLSHLFKRIGTALERLFRKIARHSLTSIGQHNYTIVPDDLHPSSALIWLLNRRNRRQWSTTATIGILEELSRRNNSSIQMQNSFQNKAQWSNIFDSISIDLYRQRSKSKVYSEDVERQFATMLQASLIVGGENLSGTAHSVLLSNPFTQYSFQTKPLGLLCRFALWKSQRPFPIDSCSPPLDLFRKICQSCAKEYQIVVIYTLQELESSLMNEEISREDTLDCLSGVLQTPDERTGIFGLIFQPDLINSILSLGLIALDEENRGHRNEDRKKPEELMLIILGIYYTKQENERVITSQENRFVISLIQQFILKMATESVGNQTLLQLEIFRHPSLESLWRDNSISLDLNLSALVKERLWHPTKALYPSQSISASRWTLELCHAVILMVSSFPPRITPFDPEWKTMHEALSTLASCISGSDFTERHFLLTESNRLLWISMLLQGLQPGMTDPLVAFAISALLSGPVRSHFGKFFHGKFFPSGPELFDGIESAELGVISKMLMGEEYSHLLPSFSDPRWRAPAFRVIMKNWKGFHPVIMMGSDVALVNAMIQMGEEEWDEEVLSFLGTRSRQLVSTHKFTQK
jgi:hypothetical protein